MRAFGAKLGQHVHIYPRVSIWAPWNLELGDECGVGDDTTLYSQDRIVMGSRVVVSQGSYLCTGTHDFEAPGFPLVTEAIVLETDVWIAAQCFLHPGVTVGEGAVVGARSVVCKDIVAWTVCAGNPCKVIRQRTRPGSCP